MGAKTRLMLLRKVHGKEWQPKLWQRSKTYGLAVAGGNDKTSQRADLTERQCAGLLNRGRDENPRRFNPYSLRHVKTGGAHNRLWDDTVAHIGVGMLPMENDY